MFRKVAKLRFIEAKLQKIHAREREAEGVL
jgi:hypothetical protein